MQDWVVGIAREILAVPFIMGAMLFQALFGKKVEPFDQKGDPILLSGGYLATSGQLLYLKYHLGKRAAVFTMDYGHPLASIDDFAEKMKQKVEEIQRHYPGRKLTIVGHSMGGIISARYAANCSHTDHIEKIITLGSPLQGTILAYLGLGKCAKEMRRNSPYLHQLEQDLMTKNVAFINVGSHADLIVLPSNSTSFQKVPSKKILFGSMGHFSYLCSCQVINFLIKNI